MGLETSNGRPRSKARRAASGGIATVEALGQVVVGGICDTLSGALTQSEAGSVYSGARTLVGLARNADTTDEFLKRCSAEQEQSQEEDEIAELKGRLARLESERRVPQKG